MIKRFRALTIAIALLLAPGTALAIPVLDQVFDPALYSLTLGSGIGYTDKAQTFTVGLTGVLTGVDVYIQRDPSSNSPDDLTLDIRPTSGGAPVGSDSSALASVTVPHMSLPSSPGFYHFDISSFNVSVNTGDVLAIVLRAPSTTNTSVGWFGSVQNLYTAGGHYYRNSIPQTPWGITGLGHDVGFKTYVDTAPVPEPSTLLLLGSGATGLAYARRRLRR